MDFTGIPLFSAMKSKLDYMSQRQGVLAQNVANADTPGYRAQDVKAPDFKEMAQKAATPAARKLPVTLTDPKHMSQSAGGAARYAVENRKLTDELNPTGNNVSIEEEMMKIAENQAEYQKVLNLYSKTISMFKTALGRQSG